MPLGRGMGTLNKVSAPLKEAILLAAEVVGSDGEGSDGLMGYLTTVARTDMRSFCALLGKVLPMTIAGTGDSGGIVVEIVKRTYAAGGADGHDSTPA